MGQRETTTNLVDLYPRRRDTSSPAGIVDPYTDDLILEPGIYPNVPDETYRKVQAISKSDLDKWAGGGDIDPRTALLGQVFHACILEPDIAANKIVRADIDRRSPAKWEELCEANAGKWVLTTGEYDSCMAMVDAVMRDEVLAATRDLAHANQDKTELVVVWRDEKTNVLCKAKIDQDATNSIVDWKTTGATCAEEFAASVGKFGYGEQLAHYQRGYRAATGNEKPMVFACVSKRKDKQNPTWVYRSSDAEVAAGERRIDQLLHLFAKFESDHAACLPF